MIRINVENSQKKKSTNLEILFKKSINVEIKDDKTEEYMMQEKDMSL